MSKKEKITVQGTEISYSFAHVKKSNPKNKKHHFHATFLLFLHLYKRIVEF